MLLFQTSSVYMVFTRARVLTDMKIIPLGTYDAVTGMDSLEEHSPMLVDWRGKNISIDTANGIISLSGHPTTVTCQTINGVQQHSLCRQGAMSHMVQIFRVEAITHRVPVTIWGTIGASSLQL